MKISAKNYENYPKPARTAKEIKEAILYKLIYVLGVDPQAARARHWLNAAVYVARDLLTEGWIKYRRDNFDNKERHIYYLSMEYLIGRTFINSLINSQLLDEFKGAFEELGLDFDYIVGEEDDPGLGNGGLGRLAACFMDSLATLKIPSVGYGIRYQYGMFYQEIKDGKQVEKPDLWLEKDMSWQFLRTSKRYPVFFGGTVRQGIFGDEWYPAEKLTALCYDDIIPAWGGESSNTLRLWSAHAGDDFNLSAFNKGDYYSAMEAQTKIENISRVLYPDDSTDSGRELRLRQEYFLVAASIHDIISRHKRMGNPIENLPEKVAIHLNDTHPVLAIPELMRVLVHIEGVKWEKAWEMCKKIFSYTNHTLMSEALETWPVEMMQRVLPLHLNIIYGINNQFLDEVRKKGFDIYDPVIVVLRISPWSAVLEQV